MDIDEAIKKHTPTEKATELKKLLLDIWDNQNFILGILVSLKTDEHRQKMIDLIEKEGITDSDTIILASLCIKDGDI